MGLLDDSVSVEMLETGLLGRELRRRFEKRLRKKKRVSR